MQHEKCKFLDGMRNNEWDLTFEPLSGSMKVDPVNQKLQIKVIFEDEKGSLADLNSTLRRMYTNTRILNASMIITKRLSQCNLDKI